MSLGAHDMGVTVPPGLPTAGDRAGVLFDAAHAHVFRDSERLIGRRTEEMVA